MRNKKNYIKDFIIKEIDNTKDSIQKEIDNSKVSIHDKIDNTKDFIQKEIDNTKDSIHNKIKETIVNANNEGKKSTKCFGWWGLGIGIAGIIFTIGTCKIAIDVSENASKIINMLNPYGLSTNSTDRESFYYCFNNYRSRLDGNEEAVYRLWADPFAISPNHGGKINALIQINVVETNDENTNYLDIKFIRQGYGVNFGVRPMDKTPYNAERKNFMKFSIKSFGFNRIGVRITITDRNMFYWQYGNEIMYSNYNIILNSSTVSNKWNDIKIPLKDVNWHIFQFDGRQDVVKNKPDYSSISCIQFEIGYERNSISDAVDRYGFIKNLTNEGELFLSPIYFE